MGGQNDGKTVRFAAIFLINLEKTRFQRIPYLVPLGSWTDSIKSFHFGTSYSKVPVLYLWTEKGAWLHAKSLNTDRAWEAYEMLIDEYYRLKEQQSEEKQSYQLPRTFAEALRQLADRVEENQKLQDKIQQEAPKVEAYQSFMSAENALPVNEIAKSMELGPNNLFSYMRDWRLMFKNDEGYNLPYQQYINQGFFIVKTKTFWNHGIQKNSSRTFVTPKGQELIFTLARKHHLIKRESEHIWIRKRENAM